MGTTHTKKKTATTRALCVLEGDGVGGGRIKQHSYRRSKRTRRVDTVVVVVIHNIFFRDIWFWVARVPTETNTAGRVLLLSSNEGTRASDAAGRTKKEPVPEQVHRLASVGICNRGRHMSVLTVRSLCVIAPTRRASQRASAWKLYIKNASWNSISTNECVHSATTTLGTPFQHTVFVDSWNSDSTYYYWVYCILLLSIFSHDKSWNSNSTYCAYSVSHNTLGTLFQHTTVFTKPREHLELRFNILCSFSHKNFWDSVSTYDCGDSATQTALGKSVST